MIGRGGLSEIGTFLDELEIKTDNNMPVSQLCPVGKLFMGEADENNSILEELEAREAVATCTA
jgi:NADH dehydrogenase (ubiquinone) Fe-S protein 1